MIPVVVFRPQPGCDASVAGAKVLGLEAYGFPLFTVAPLAWEAPEPESFDALLIGSANALRHGGAALESYRGKPAYAVGETSAAAARAAGFAVEAVGAGGLQELLGQIRPEHRRLLRLAGRERVPLTVPAGFTLAECVVYASKPQPMPPELVALLARPALVLLHSAEAAGHFDRECISRAIDRSQIAIAAIGPRVADAAGEGWAALTSAASPGDPALLALAREMCQTSHDREQDRPPTMQDEILTPPYVPERRSRGFRTMAIIALLAFLLGAAGVAWLDWKGTVDFATLPEGEASGVPQRLASDPDTPSLAITAPPLSGGPVEARLAIVEERLARLNLQAEAASGNAERAESLLVAFATRRTLDRGAPLGYLEDLLRLHFGDAQPNAVRIIIEAARVPVTLDELSSQLDAAGPALARSSGDEDAWTRIKREVSGLVVIRRDDTPSPAPESRLSRARLMLAAGKVDGAIAEVERLPGAGGVRPWIASARRFSSAQRALDLIETAAMLDPRSLPEFRRKPAASTAVPPAPSLDVDPAV